MRVLISVLGYYKTYREVTYEVANDRNEVVSGQTRFSSAALKKAFSPDRTIVIVPFSLYHESVGEAVKELPGGKYSELARAVVNRFNSEAGPFVIGELFVAPNTGRFTGRDGGAFEYVEAGVKGRRLSLFQNYAFFKLYEALKGVKDDRVEILVDLTHGVNYMQFLVSDVVRALAYSLLKDVKLRFFNSDPVGPGRDDPGVVVRINEVVRENISPKEGFSGAVMGLMTLDDRDLREALGNNNDYRDKVRRLANASFAGVLQVVGAFRDEINRLLDLALNPIRGIDGCEVKVSGNDNLTRLEYGCSVPPLAYKVVAALDAMYKATEGWEEEFSSSWLMGKVKKYGNPVMEDLVENELDIISRRVELDGSWRYLSEAPRKQEKREREGRARRANKRNLIAHGGLEENVTCAKREGDEVYFKYCAEEGFDVYGHILRQF